MAYDEMLAGRIRLALGNRLTDMEEKRMFGGLSFLYKGKMTVGIIQDRLMARVPAAYMEQAMRIPDTRPMDFTGKAMKEFVDVGSGGLETEEQLQQWIEWGLEHAEAKSQKKK